jgi:hypothetical protein
LIRLLLDENINVHLAGRFGKHHVETIRAMGWSGRKNGELLGLMIAFGFDAFITLDKGIAHQHKLDSIGLAVIILRSRSSRLEDVELLIPNVLSLLQVGPGPGVYEIS